MQSAFYREGITDEKSLHFICKALTRHNLPGYDYLEMKAALERMRGMQIEGETAIRSAFASALTLGATKSGLLESLDRYRQILLREREDFDKALADAMQRKIQARREDMQGWERRVLDLEAEIHRLQQELAATRESIQAGRAAIEAASGELERSERAFRQTFDQVIRTIQADQEQMQRLLD